MRTLAASVALALAAACKPAQDRIPIDTGARTADSIAAGQYTVADFRNLRWLEGRWRGFMPDGKTFYEQYRFLDDSTIAMHSFADSTFTRSTDSSRVQLRNSAVTSAGLTAAWVATRLDSTGADFAPQRGVSNRFTWARESATRWNATLRWTDSDGRPQSVVYALHKLGR
jgi:hypothetical protein